MSDGVFGYILACLISLFAGVFAGMEIQSEHTVSACKRQGSFYTHKEDFQCTLKAKHE
ncbi:hypothetical protein [Methylibium sp.]|uniref:hypothetical protein n=1 Tax=Methylibium sp. TaxID=2067992 RepID=UPI003BAB1F33